MSTLPITRNDDDYAVGVCLTLDLKSSKPSASTPNFLNVRIERMIDPWDVFGRFCLVSPVGYTGSQLPQQLCLKVFDHRFNTRQCRRDEPWTPEAEDAARKWWADLAAGRSSEQEYEDAQWDEGEFPLAFKQESYWRRSEALFTSEDHAYERLLDLQGTTVPICYGSCTVRNFSILSPNRPTHAILLEYIEGVSLDRLDVSAHSPLELQSIYTPLIRAVDEFSLRGIMHGDLQLQNIMLGSSGRIVITNFGISIPREDDLSDVEWDAQVKDMDTHGELKWSLHLGSIRARSPAPLPKNPLYGGYGWYNACIGRQSEEWQRRWYDSTGITDSMEGPLWMPKPEVARWLENRSASGPRPGSPDLPMPLQSRL